MLLKKLREEVLEANLELVRRGLVRFELDPGDRRRSRLSLSRRGSELVRKLRPIAGDLRARLVSGMDAAEETALRESLRKVIRNLQGPPMARLEAFDRAPPAARAGGVRGRRR